MLFTSTASKEPLGCFNTRSIEPVHPTFLNTSAPLFQASTVAISSAASPCLLRSKALMDL